MFAARKARRPVNPFQESDTMNLKKKSQVKQNRIWRIRKKIVGTAERPRLCLTISNKHLYAQAIDDTKGHTLLSMSTLDKDLREEKLLANRTGAEKLGQLFGQKALAQGLESVVFDRHGRIYHGNVKTFADAARAAGLKF
jgi:large subunit ribosomal protein L18